MNSDVITLEASDPDSPALMYIIQSGNDGIYFRINSNTGLIQTARALDREQVAVFSLQVTASDQDGNIGETTLQISIADVNDEAPIFLQPSYYARVPENSPAGTQVLPVSLMLFHILIAITSVWNVQFQQFKHLLVACNELFHLIHLTQKYFSTQI